MKKSWREKLEDGKPATVKRLDKNFAGMKAGQIMLIPSAKLIDNYIGNIPESETQSVEEMRNHLAKTFNADVTCPIATGFALKTVAEAAYEKLVETDDLAEITPIWRLLNAESKTMKKVSFDNSFITIQRESEGIQN